MSDQQSLKERIKFQLQFMALMLVSDRKGEAAEAYEKALSLIDQLPEEEVSQ